MSGLGARCFSERQERSFIAYSQHLMGAFLAQRQNEFANTARDYAVWDEMSAHVSASADDRRWLEQNVTASIYRDFGVDDVLLVDAELRPVYALHRGERVKVEKLADWNGRFARLLEASTAGAPGLQSVAGVVRSRDGWQQVQAERIRSELGSAADARPLGWIVFARELGSTWIDEISALLSIRELRLGPAAPSGDEASLALSGVDGQPVAWLSWRLVEGQRRGEVVMPLLFGLCALSVFVTLIASAVLRMREREIDTHARMLRQSESLRELARLPLGGESAEREEQILARIADSVRQTLAVARVTLWRARDDGWRCIAASGARPGDETVLDAHAHAGYLYALAEERIVAAADVATDARLAELAATYRANGVRSTLDAAVIVRG